MKTEIYSVFPACGKSWIFDNQDRLGISVLDSDFSQFIWCMRKRTEKEAQEFIARAVANGRAYNKLSDIQNVYDEVLLLRNPEFPGNYIQHIKEKLGTCEYLFVSSHEEVRSALKAAGLPFTLVYPEKQCLAEWVGRHYMCGLSGKNRFPIKTLIDNWYKWIEQCDLDDGASCKIRLGFGQYLLDGLACSNAELAYIVKDMRQSTM